MNHAVLRTRDIEAHNWKPLTTCRESIEKMHMIPPVPCPYIYRSFLYKQYKSLDFVVKWSHGPVESPLWA